MFGGLGLVPTERSAKVGETGVTWNYTTVLNIVFLLVALALVVRFLRSGGVPMLRMMGGSPDHDGVAHGGAHVSATPTDQPSAAAPTPATSEMPTLAAAESRKPPWARRSVS